MNIYKKVFWTAFFWLNIAMFNGCALDKSHYAYVPGKMIDMDIRPLPVTVHIDYLDDLRLEENEDKVGITLLPLVPYVKNHYGKPELDRKFKVKCFKPSEDFAKALQIELLRNTIFYSVKSGPGSDSKSADLIISGRIKTASVDTTTTLYGMSLVGILPWVTGLPQGMVYNSLNVEYEMRRSSDGVVVWKGDIDGKWNRLFGLYYNYAPDEPYTGINEILRHQLHDVLTVLAEDIKKDPQKYWPH